jgi:hypothetical protein
MNEILFERRLVNLMAKSSPHGGENIFVATPRMIKNTVDEHIRPQFDPMGDAHAIAVGVGMSLKELFLNGLANVYHGVRGNTFNVKPAGNNLFESTKQRLGDTGGSAYNGEPINTVVNGVQTITEGPAEDATRFLGMYKYILEQEHATAA